MLINHDFLISFICIRDVNAYDDQHFKKLPNKAGQCRTNLSCMSVKNYNSSETNGFDFVEGRV